MHRRKATRWILYRSRRGSDKCPLGVVKGLQGSSSSRSRAFAWMTPVVFLQPVREGVISYDGGNMMEEI
eukprot:700735-Hanusia_phi.AAC.1